MNKKVIRIPYGNAGHKQVTQDIKHIRDLKLYTKLWTEELMEYVYEYLLSIHNGNKRKVSLLWYENAIDWQIKLKIIPLLISVLKQGKILKYINIEIEFDEEDY